MLRQMKLWILATLAGTAFGALPPPPEMTYEVQRSDSSFSKDLSHDMRPRATTFHKQYNFRHPFPHVQENDDFDKDFVKDENDDGGHWKLQEEYDRLRIHAAKVQREVDRLRGIAEEERAALDAAKRHEGDQEHLAKDEDGEFKSARAKADSAADKVTKLKNDVEVARAAVDEEVEHLSMCRDELVEAKHGLERKLDEFRRKQEAEDAHLGDVPNEPTTTAAYYHAQMEMEAHEADAEDAEHFDEDVLSHEKEEFLGAEHYYETWLLKVTDTQNHLDALAARIRKYRAGEDPDAKPLHAIAEIKRSGANGRGVTALFTLLVSVVSA